MSLSVSIRRRRRRRRRLLLVVVVCAWSLLLVLAGLVQASVPTASLDDKENDRVLKRMEHDADPIINYQFRHRTVIIPHDDKKYRGGEDAAATSDRLLTVADGVGGWARHGVNPGLYSKLLTQTIINLYKEKEKQSNSDFSNSSPHQLLLEIVESANQVAASQHLGSATCTVVQLTSPNTVQTLNIGDSGYSIHRRIQYNKSNENDNSDKDTVRFEVVFASQAGQKAFNFPYQIGGPHGDTVRKVAQLDTHPLQEGDIVILFSDGVSDNLYPHEFHGCIDRYTKTSTNTNGSTDNELVHGAIADCVARQAYYLGKDKTFDSPFAQGAKSVGKYYRGGKHDDITVTVATIVVADTSETSTTSSRSSSGPSSAPTTTPTSGIEFDLHLGSQSIYLYTGHVPSHDELPTLNELLQLSSTGSSTDSDDRVDSRRKSDEL